MKIISYSIFGEEEFYRKGLRANIDIANSLFPDWIVRVYCCSKLPKDFINSIDKPNVEIIVKEQKYNFNGLLWRMLPMQENHDVVIVRDVDTRVFQRDKNLVDDWLDSRFKYHICRDNQGSTQPILAGLWGGKNSALPIRKTWDKWVKKENAPDAFLWDQSYLIKFVYPRMVSDLVVYTEHNIYEGEKNVFIIVHFHDISTLVLSSAVLKIHRYFTFFLHLNCDCAILMAAGVPRTHR